ncbi:HalX domain-containing protein [Thermococcus sp.]|uniref:HalX domain-containing protein n=1 Tax=Thermococcus sp. TaxID=35749 RepID=UPI002639CF5D|nr:HalX domain-containing protein [Thermococcus sp.]
MAESVHILVSRIEKIEKELEALKLELLKLQAEKDEAEIIPEQEYQELKKRAERLKNNPSEGLSADDAIKELLS